MKNHFFTNEIHIMIITDLTVSHTVIMIMHVMFFLCLQAAYEGEWGKMNARDRGNLMYK